MEKNPVTKDKGNNKFKKKIIDMEKKLISYSYKKSNELFEKYDKWEIWPWQYKKVLLSFFKKDDEINFIKKFGFLFGTIGLLIVLIKYLVEWE